MRNLRVAATAILLASFVGALAAQSTPGSEQKSGTEGDADAMDVVVLLDLSQSTLPYFQDVTDYVVSSVVKDYLRLGDTFHLLSFGETAQSEIAQRVTSETDVKAVLGRLYLLYPLARYSDLVGALAYLNQYLSDLPENRRKVVVVITDGVHNPPPGSRTFGMTPDMVTAEIDSSAARIRANGWPVRIIKLPFPKPGEPGAPASGTAEAKGRSYLDAAAAALGADVSDFSTAGRADVARKSLSQPLATYPDPLGKKDYAFSFQLKLQNGSDSPIGLELDRVKLGEADILVKKVFLTLQGGRSGAVDVPVLIPEDVPEGPSKLEIQLHFAGGVRVSPDTGILDLTLARNPVASFVRSGAGSIALFIAMVALGLAAILAVIMIVRRMPRRAEAPIAAAVLLADAEMAPAAPAAVDRAKEKRGAKADSSATAKADASTRTEATASARAGAAARAVDSDREASATASAAALAAQSREESARSVALLAEAARPGSAAAATAAGVPARTDREALVDGSAANLVAQRREDGERTVALLAEASGRRQPARRPSAEEEAKARSAAAAYAPRVVKPGSMTVELLVEEQNPHIGSRNVQTLHAGGAKSVGGGASDFLVFLVSVPRRSAELHFDGEKLSFVPLRPELFPELAGPVEDCLGKTIPMISRSGYPLRLRFAVYERPVDKINRLLHSIDTAGLMK